MANFNQAVTNLLKPLAAPSAPTVGAGAVPGSLSVSWSGPNGAVPGTTDYDLRYYKGTTNPMDAAD